jgi:hypothetical protein
VFIYSIFILILLSIVLWKVRIFRVDGLSEWNLPLAFIVKFVVGLLLFLMHIQTYGVDELSHDGETFFKEGKLLHDIFFVDPSAYFRLLTGIGETESLVHEHLSMTEYWSSGDLSIINDSKNVIRIHSLIHFFSLNSVYVHLAIMCFITLIGHLLLFISFRDFIKIRSGLLFWILLLIPSTIYWTSSIMKEPMMFLGLSILMFTLLKRHTIWKKLILLVLAFVLLIGFKPYILLCLLFALSFVAVYSMVFKYRILPSVTGAFLFLLIALVFLDKPRDVAVHYLTRKQFDFVNVGKGGLHAVGDTCIYYFQPHQYNDLEITGRKVLVKHPVDAYSIKFGSTRKPLPVHLDPSSDTLETIYSAPGCNSFIETTPINSSVSQLMKNIPEALTNAAIRPFPWDPGSSLKYLSLIEVWLIFSFLILALLYRRKLNKKRKTIVIGLFIFALCLFLLIGWTTPVIGAIARYRFPAQLALILIGLIIIDPNKLLKHE